MIGVAYRFCAAGSTSQAGIKLFLAIVAQLWLSLPFSKGGIRAVLGTDPLSLLPPPTFFFLSVVFPHNLFAVFPRQKQNQSHLLHLQGSERKDEGGRWGGICRGWGDWKKNERKGEERKIWQRSTSIHGTVTAQLSSSTYSISARGLLPRKGHAEKIIIKKKKKSPV